MKKRPKRSKFAQVRHAFLCKVISPTGESVGVSKAWAKVRYTKEPVDLVLTADDVRQSIKLKGVGNTSTCSMAVCALNHKDAFPHPVIGHIDWTYSRAFVASRLNKQGLPSECYAYEHGDDIAKLNDSPGGQKRLLRKLVKDGPMTIQLKPYRKRSEVGRSGVGRKTTGARAVEKRLKGAKLRYAVMQLGGLPV